MRRETKKRCRQLAALLIAFMVFLSGSGVSTLAATISGNDALQTEDAGVPGGVQVMTERRL